MSTIQVLILSIFIAFLILENYGYGYWMISRPIFAGPLIGLLLGDVQTGLLVGGSVELMYMGVIPVGGSVPPNAQIAGILSTVFAILNGGNAEVGIALALPIGLLAQLLIMLAWNLNIILIHGADKYVQAGDYRKVEKMQLSGLVVFFFVFFIPTFLAIQFGSDFVNNVVAAMPPVLTDGLKDCLRHSSSSGNGNAVEDDEFQKILVVLRAGLCIFYLSGTECTGDFHHCPGYGLRYECHAEKGCG